MPNATLLDIAKLNGSDQVVGLIEENLAAAPEVANFPARTIRGTSFYTVKRTGFPAVGFRGANEGVAASKSSFDKQLVECFVLAAAVEIDKAVAQAYEDGAAAYEMLEASGVMRAALIATGRQIWYGTAAPGDAKGFPGIKALTPKGGTIVVDATGSTANTASSVYAVKYGVQNCSIVMGNNAVFELSQFRDQMITDDSGAKYAGRVADLTAWTGLMVGNANCVGRICNLTADSNKTLSDALIAKLLSSFPVGWQPDALYMSRRSAYQLQVSRSVTIQANAGRTGGSQAVADWPASAFGVPIVVTDSIGNTDAIE